MGWVLVEACCRLPELFSSKSQHSKKIVRLCLAFSVQLETALCTVNPPPTHQARNPMGMYDFAPKNEIMIILRRGVHKYFVLQKKDLITSE